MSSRVGGAGRLRSFGYALRGLVDLLRTQPNARIHLLATAGVVALGLALDVTRVEWLALLLAMGLVWSAEAFNTGLEALGDAVSPDAHPEVGRAKDVAAAGVLLAAVAAAVVGLLVLGPPLLAWLRAELTASG